MALLLKYYSIYRKEGVKEPKEVLDITKKYRCYNDLYTEFANEKIIENPSGVLKIKEAYDEFKYWYKENYNDNKCPKNKEFKTQLDKIFGINKSKPNEIKGISLKPDDDDPTI